MEDIWLVETDGKRRRASKRICVGCGKEFLARINSSKSACSPECGGSARQQRLIVECAVCGKKYGKCQSKMANSKSGLHFCSRNCKDKGQRLGGIEAIMPPHYGRAESQEVCKRYIKNIVEPKCEDCGDCRRYLLAVHHKDGNKKNNVETNFEIVCFSCHGKRHLKMIDGCWVYCTKALTPRHLLNSL